MRHIPKALVVLIASLTSAAHSQQPARNSFFEPSVLSVSITQPEAVERAGSFGEASSQHLSFGSMMAPNFSGELDVSIFGQYTYFVVDDFEVGVEAALWQYFQDDDTVGVSTSLILRYHFYQAERWSAFAEAGMGMMLAADHVPDNGTSFNLMPRLGVGMTWQMFEDSSLRLITGLRWHHISNARIEGEEDNPARDAPGLYAGLLYEF